MESSACIESSECVTLPDMKKGSPTNVKISKADGTTFEVAGLSVNEIKELIGMNGHTPANTRTARVSANKNAASRIINGQPDYAGFRKALTDKGKQFLDILKQRPHGVSADDMAQMMGFTTSNQIGGTAGGGMSRIAPTYNVDLENVYIRETTFKNGTRQTLYKPGKDIQKL